MPFLSASINLGHHLCLEGKSVGSGHDKLLLGAGTSGRGLLACLYFLPPDSVPGDPAEMVISPHWQFVSIRLFLTRRGMAGPQAACAGTWHAALTFCNL